MRSKGFIKWVAILMSVACLYELSFTFVANNVEKAAVEKAKTAVDELIAKNEVSAAERDSVKLLKQKKVDVGFLAKEDSAYLARVEKKIAIVDNRSKLLTEMENHYLDSMSNVEVYNLGLMKFTYKECREKSLNLGLDLKGGMNIMLGVQIGDVVKSLAVDKKEANMIEAIKAADKITEKSDDDYIDVFAEEYNRISGGASLAKLFVGGGSEISEGMSNGEVIDILKDNAEAAIVTSVEVIGNRIDRFGVVQPNIQRITGTNRILVELPGVKDPKRVEKLLSGAASLEFWETYSAREGSDPMKASVITSKMGDAAQAVQAYYAANPNQHNYGGLLDILVVLENRGGGVVGGVTSENNQKIVSDYLALPEVHKIFGDEVLFMWGSKPDKNYNNLYLLYAIYDEHADGKAPLDGSVITEARANYSQHGSSAEVSMSMNSHGIGEWARLTGANIGKSIAIVLDGYVYSSPVVNDRIEGGNSSITGDFTIQEAEDLANILKSGKVPASAKVLQKEVVGPSLGQESINSGLLSILLAFVLVLIYMALFYRTAGLYADIALVFNIFLLIGCIVSLGAALTLPGIAGIVLTMGMAVDANVIIFERIKEELRGGKGIHAAIKDGFSHAYSAIIDGNLTTIITGVVLFFFGTGPVKGFATTLIVGILTSAFTAIFITRLLIDRHVEKRGKVSFSYKWSENLLSNIKFDFIGKRFWAYLISGVIIIAGILSLTFKGLNLGVEFTGGSTYVVRFDQPVSVDDVRAALNEAFEKEGADAAKSSVEVKQYGGDNQVRIVTQYKPEANVAVATENVDSNADNTGNTGNTGNENAETTPTDGAQANDVAEVADPEKEVVDVSDDRLAQIIYEAVKGFYKEPISFEDFSSTVNNPNGVVSSSEIGPAIAKDMTTGAAYSILFALVAIGLYIIFRFRKWQWAAGATIALAHDAFMIIALFSMLYSIMPFNLEVNQAFIAAILTIIGYSINDTVVIFDRIREYIGLYPKRDLKSTINSALASTMMRTLNTSGTTLVTLLAIFTFGGEAVRGFVFALIIGIVVGTYSSLFIASPLAYDMQRKKAKKKQQQLQQEDNQ